MNGLVFHAKYFCRMANAMGQGLADARFIGHNFNQQLFDGLGVTNRMG